MKTKQDSNVWRKLENADGYVPRRWMYVGQQFGKQCRFEVRLTKKHDTLDNYYRCSAVFAHNVTHAPELVRLDQLEPLS
jgi:hypothetical protein